MEPQTTRLLLVDDDTELCALMAEFFSARGLACDSVHTGPRGLAAALDGHYHLVLLDVMLPGLDGFEILRQLRLRSAVPVIMLTARTAPTDRVAGLEAGADDYLPKPFGPEELLARIRAVLRRAHPALVTPLSELVEFAGFRLNPAARQASLDGRDLELTDAEYSILDILVRNPGRIVSRDEIASALHQREASPFERSIDVHISNLRKKLGVRRDGIRTVRGSGYLLRMETAPEPEP